MLLDAMKSVSATFRKDTRPSTCFIDNMLDGRATPPVTLDRFDILSHSFARGASSIQTYLCL